MKFAEIVKLPVQINRRVEDRFAELNMQSALPRHHGIMIHAAKVIASKAATLPAITSDVASIDLRWIVGYRVHNIEFNRALKEPSCYVYERRIERLYDVTLDEILSLVAIRTQDYCAAGTCEMNGHDCELLK